MKTERSRQQAEGSKQDETADGSPRSSVVGHRSALTCERCLNAPASCRIKSDEMNIVVCTMCGILALGPPYEGESGKMSVERVGKAVLPVSSQAHCAVD